MKRKVVIIGGTAAGTTVAATIARLSINYEVVLFEQTPYISVATCNIPRFITGQIDTISDMVRFKPEDFQNKYGITVFTDTRVTSITPFKRNITVYDDQKSFERSEHYDILVFATGAKPRRLQISGCAAQNILSIKSLESALVLRQFLKEKSPRKAIIVGGGAVGLAMAEAFHYLGIESTIVEMKCQILHTFDRDMAEFLEEALIEKGIKLYKNEQIQEYILKDDLCSAVRLQKNREILKTDFVLETIGVEPRTSLAKNVGIHIGQSGAIHVDNTMKTSHINIYAVGDCVELPHFFSGKPGYFPRGSYAVRCGRIAGLNIMGQHTRLPGVLDTMIMSFQDVHFGRTGLTFDEAKKLSLNPYCVNVSVATRTEGIEDSGTIRIKLIFTKDSVLLGGQFIGSKEISGHIQTLALALQQRLKVHDLLFSDFGYHPSVSTLWSPLHVAARKAIRKLKPA